MTSTNVNLDEYERLIIELHEEIQGYGAVRRDLGGMVGGLEQIRSAQAIHNQRLEALVNRASLMLGALEPLRGEVERALGEQDAAIQSLSRQHQEALAATVARLEASIGGVNANTLAAVSRIGDVAASIDATAAQIGTLATASEVDALRSRMASLEDELANVRPSQRLLLGVLVATLVVAAITAIGVFA